MQEDCEQKIGEYKETFGVNAVKYIDKPVSQREVTNPCCLVMFIVIFVGFVFYSAFSLNRLLGISDFDIQNPDASILKNVDF